MSTYHVGTQLSAYLSELTLRGLSTNYITKIGELLARYVATVPEISQETAKQFLGRYSQRKPNTKARYATYLRGFLAYLGIPFPLKVKVPRALPAFVPDSDVAALTECIQHKVTHKQTQFRDLVIIETARKTGLRRSELAHLRVCDLDLVALRLKVVGGKGDKDRVIPLVPALADMLRQLCSGKQPDGSVFGLTPRSLGMQIYAWSKKANVKLHTHSLRHHFATTLVDKGANIRAVQELLGHANLNTTQVYVAVTSKHLEQAISLLG